MSRIIADPEILGRKPVVAGTRMSVEFVLQCLSSGMGVEDVVKEYPQLTSDDIYACLDYAVKNIGNDVVVTLVG